MLWGIGFGAFYNRHCKLWWQWCIRNATSHIQNNVAVTNRMEVYNIFEYVVPQNVGQGHLRGESVVRVVFYDSATSRLQHYTVLSNGNIYRVQMSGRLGVPHSYGRIYPR